MPVLAGDTRIIDLGAQDARVASALADEGLSRYLALTPPDALARARSTADERADRFVALDDSALALKFSADLLILRAPYARILWAAPDLDHLKYVAVERGLSGQTLEGRAAAALARAAKRLMPLGQRRWGSTTFDLYGVPQPDPPSTRIYFSPIWGAKGLAARLRQSGLRYAVLRWFEDLPAIAPGEDLDILVADADLEAFRSLVATEPGTKPIDLYSASGIAGSDYRGTAYYAPKLAHRILEGAVEHPSGFLVPASLDHLHSLAYHAVYHKGPRAGLPSDRLGPGETNPEHDYAAALGELAEANRVSFPSSFEEIDRYLDSVDWRPPVDALRRLSISNPWIELLLHGGEPAPDDDSLGEAELAVFLLREAALSVIEPDDVVRILEQFAFDILLTEPLEGEPRQRAAHSLRGGNWGRGPFPRSGGEPAVLIAALHHSPREPEAWLLQKFPHLTNAEVFYAKVAIRELVDTRVPESERFNALHSADSTQEAWEYLQIAVPERVAALRREAATRASGYGAPEGIVANLSRGRRSRVDIIEQSGRRVVRKTFVPAFVRFMEREVAAMKTLSSKVDAIPEVIDEGPNWFTMPFYENVLGDLDAGPQKTLLRLRTVRGMVSVLRRLYLLGYDVVDARPRNFLIDSNRRMKIIDLEFLFAYGDDRPPFAQSANFVGPWPGFDGDIPVGDTSYEARWLPYTGLPVHALADGSPAQQRLIRTRFRIRRATVAPGSPPRRALSRLRGIARHGKWVLRAHMSDWAHRRVASLAGAGDAS